eukprot:scaffold103850_cov28-Tisochrysis_lutea.AAC.1
MYSPSSRPCSIRSSVECAISIASPSIASHPKGFVWLAAAVRWAPKPHVEVGVPAARYKKYKV